MSDIDWAALLKHLTAQNVAKWVLVIGFAAFAIIAASNGVNITDVGALGSSRRPEHAGRQPGRR